MKKLLLVALFVLLFSIPSFASDVCGKSYKWDSFTMKFSTSPFGPGCSGNVEVKSNNQAVVYQFISFDNIITVFDLGEFVLRSNELIYICPAGIILTEY